jgi:hypothetical protein
MESFNETIYLTNDDLDRVIYFVKKGSEKYKQRIDHWGRGMLQTPKQVRSVDIEPHERPHVVGKCGEVAVAKALSASVDFNINDGDCGVDIWCGGSSIQVKTQTANFSPKLINTKRIGVSAYFVFCTWHASRQYLHYQVLVHGWCTREIVLSSNKAVSPRQSASHCNYQISSSELKPISTLRLHIQEET